MNEMNAVDYLRDLGACDLAIEWVEQQDQTPQALWDTCQRGEWLAWMLGRIGRRDGWGSPAHRRATLVVCLCARTASAWWTDPACEAAVDIAERWSLGDNRITRAELRAASNAASNVAVYAADDVAVYAAYAANAAANAHAAGSLFYRDARDRHLRDLADLIRAAVPEVPL